MINATLLAYNYNIAKSGERADSALADIKDIFIEQFKWKVQKHAASEIKKHALIYSALQIKWIAFCLRTGVSEDLFPIFLNKAFPFETQNAFKILKKHKNFTTTGVIVSHCAERISATKF